MIQINTRYINIISQHLFNFSFQIFILSEATHCYLCFGKKSSQSDRQAQGTMIIFC